MARNDSALITGSTSANFSKKKERNEEKLRKKDQLVEVAPFVFDEIEKHRNELGEVLNQIVNGDDHEEEVMVKLQAVRLHRQYLAKLENKLKIVLKAKPLKGAKK